MPGRHHIAVNTVMFLLRSQPLSKSCNLSNPSLPSVCGPAPLDPQSPFASISVASQPVLPNSYLNRA